MTPRPVWFTADELIGPNALSEGQLYNVLMHRFHAAPADAPEAIRLVHYQGSSRAMVARSMTRSVLDALGYPGIVAVAP